MMDNFRFALHFQSFRAPGDHRRGAHSHLGQYYWSREGKALCALFFFLVLSSG